jgi:hypothetical protein
VLYASGIQHFTAMLVSPGTPVLTLYDGMSSPRFQIVQDLPPGYTLSILFYVKQ